MTDGFIKTAAGTIDVQVADVQTNTDTILARVRQADAAGVDLLTLPELCLTGYTCGDLFFSDCLLGAVEPLLNPVWVLIFYGEKPGVFALIGGVVVIVTITVWCIKGQEKAPKEAKA